ncbi:hypothetical protein SeLEV6574_g00579 [Synchytrium endobioticum]|uniref:Uncharacterized protein n=1 Tax=Synchytrium endobioticum TaxID=286115 RepID=A0A507DHB3_9FUNG|nr:hypothetical protein SeLEV6574_g00579 [Synchytrium endobioticum]
MVNPIKVGVAALLIFVTFSQSAPADPGDEEIDRIAGLLGAKRLRIIETGLAGKSPCVFLASAIKFGEDPMPVILEEINNIIEVNLPETSTCTYDQVLNPSELMVMDRDQLRIARAYHAYIFEMLKRLFLYIQSYVSGQYANLMECNRLLAGLAFVWDVLVVYYILENMCRDCYRHASACDGLKLPIHYLDQQYIAELSRDITQPFAFSHNLRHIMNTLGSSLKDKIAKLQRDYIMNRLGPTDCNALAHAYRIIARALDERSSLRRYLPRDAAEASGVLRRLSELDTIIMHHYRRLLKHQASLAEGVQEAPQYHNIFNQPNAHGNNEAFPSVADLTNDADESTHEYNNIIGQLDSLGNYHDHEDDRDRPPPELIDFFGKSEKQHLESLDGSLAMHDPERWKGTTPPVEEPSPFALSSSHWHHSKSSPHSDGKGKRPMDGTHPKVSRFGKGHNRLEARRRYNTARHSLRHIRSSETIQILHV